jgi:hypothetical protein
LNVSVENSYEWFDMSFEIKDVGPHKFLWKYKKFSEAFVSDDLSAEIEWIRIDGVKLMNKEC